MKLLLLSIILFASLTTFSQSTDASYHLLWFQGKKIKPNVLLTTKGDTVFYNPKNGVVQVSGKSTKSMDVMRAELEKTPKRIQQTLSRLSAALPKVLSPYFSTPVQQAYGRVKQEYRDILSNSIQLPDWLAAKSLPSAGNGGPSSDGYDREDWDKLLEEFTQRVTAYGNKIRGELVTDVPVPPRRDIGYCYECDTVTSNELKEHQVFIEKLWGEEEEVQRDILGAWRTFQLMGDEGGEKKLRLVTEPVMDLIIHRKGKKLQLLIERYFDDPHYNHTVMQIAMSSERDRQLRGYEGIGEMEFHKLMDRYLLAYYQFLVKAKAEFNYSVMLDVRNILAMERTMQLMGTERGYSYLELYLSFNSFKMSINVSEKMGAEETFVVSQLKGDNYFSAVPGEDCKLKWILTGPDKDNMKFTLVSGEIIAPVRPQYTGTKDWFSPRPIMKLDFCDGADTIEIATMLPVGFKERWEYPAPLYTQYFASISGAIQACFIKMERVYAEAGHWSNSANVEELRKKMLAEQEKFMKNANGVLGKDPSSLTPEEMMKLARSLTSSDKVNELTQATAAMNFLVTTEAENKSKTVFKTVINGKELFPENGAIQYAFFHIRMEQDEKSSYKINIHGNQ